MGNIRITIQRTMQALTPELRGIRMDVEVVELAEHLDEKGNTEIKNIYDVEPNTNQAVDLPRHNRFYQAKIDSQNMKSGEKKFIKLPNLFVITITNYDPFGHDYMMYMTFEEKLFYEKLEGKIEGKIEDILELLEEYGDLPEDILSKVKSETDMEKIKKWHKLAAKVDTLEAFIENM